MTGLIGTNTVSSTVSPLARPLSEDIILRHLSAKDDCRVDLGSSIFTMLNKSRYGGGLRPTPGLTSVHRTLRQFHALHLCNVIAGLRKADLNVRFCGLDF